MSTAIPFPRLAPAGAFHHRSLFRAGIRCRALLGLLIVLALQLPVRADVTHYRSGVLAEPALLSFYPFDGDLGATATDRIAPAQNGTLVGATFSSATGTIGLQSVQGARVALGPVSDYEFSDGSGTVEMFLFQSAASAYNPCFFAGRDDGQSPAVRYSLHGDTQGTRLWIWNGAAAPNVATPVNMLNRLVHVAYVFEAGLVTIYFDGQPIGSVNAPLGTGIGRSFQIGASGPGNQEAWPGRIDEVAIYGEALPAAAVAAHYSAWQNAGAGSAPVITQQPQNLALDNGQTAVFSVQLADATGAVYRWTRNGTNMPGATNASLFIASVALVDNNSVFRCVVYNRFGGTNSGTALLAVRSPPSFLVPPVDTIRYTTQPVSLTAVVNGSLPLSFQWFKDGQLIPGATNIPLSIPAAEPSHAGLYVLTAINVFGAITSAPARLSVVPVAILAGPDNAVRFTGQFVSLNVVVAGVAPVTYQWARDDVPLPGSTNSTLHLGPLTLGDAAAYSVTVSNIHGATTSPDAILTVLNVSTPQTVRTPPPFEWLPQDNGTSADAVVLFNEIMYHPGPGSSPALQWIELHNVMRVDVDLSRWQLDGGVHYTFPSNTIVPGGGFVVVAGDLAVFTNATGIAGVFGPFTNNLANGGEHLILRNHDGRMMDELTYSDESPWPEGADGSGATLSKRTPLSASSQPTHWRASARVGGTPGRPNDSVGEPASLVLNELDSATNTAARIELINAGTNALQLANYTLSTTATNGATNFALPPLSLPPGGFAIFSAAETGFQPAQNDRIFLLTSNASLLVSAASVKNQLRGRSPDAVGRWQRPTAESFGASNQFVFNRDVVINEIMFEATPSYPTNTHVASDEEWVELFNRGTNVADLSGWSLDNAITYSFPPGTLLPPGTYLVVARDAAAVLAAHPGIRVLSGFKGRLAGKTDLIELRDAGQRIVCEVRYYSSGRWPATAAGGDSSLELIDPYADTRRAESWAASDEAARTGWQTVSYRGIATANRGYDVGYNVWNEFVMGLLDAGEILIDDVSVVDRPGTSQARQMIQNGTFENDPVGVAPAAWRNIGNHGNHGRTFIAIDPANPGNKVLRVVATGATDFLHNNLGTTLKTNGTVATVVAGREYEISFRVRRLAGCRLLNTRLYANWLQRTTVLDAPPTAGTPGAINSRRVASAGPTYTGLRHTPPVPPAGTSVTVSVQTYDPQGVATMNLRWRVDGGSWDSLPMSASQSVDESGTYRGVIPGQPAGTRVQFYVEGSDSVGGRSTFPAGGTNSRAMLVFDNGLAAPAPNFNLRFIMTGADTAALYAMTNRMSNDRLGATVVYNESGVFYDVGVRLKGSAFGRNNDTETGLSIEFHPDQPFRGAHNSISIERGNGKREILSKHLVNQAGRGVAAGYDDIAQVITPRVQDVGRCFLSMTRVTDTLLDTQYGGGGTVYNFELLYTPTTTVNGNVEAPKLNFPYVHDNGAPDLQDLGDDKEAYRWNLQIRNNRSRDDSTLMITAMKSMELNGTAFDTQTRRVIDVDQWLRAFAIASLVGNDDFYTRLYNHNLRFYQRPSDNRLVAVPWDLDRSFNLATTASLWGDAPDAFGRTNRMRKLIEYPPNLRTYYAHLQDLIATCYNTGYATRWAEHYAAVVGDSTLATYPSYIGARGTFVLSQIPAFGAFSITTSNGADFNAASNLVTLTGSAPLGLRYLRINGELFDPGWPSVTTWSARLALASGTNNLLVQGVDAQGNILSNLVDTIRVNVTVPVEDPVDRIVINEINHQGTTTGSEFVELWNTSTNTAFDLAGWHLNGTGLTFDRGTVVPPRGFLVVAANSLALGMAYGTAIPIAAEFPGRLDTDGETLSLLKPGPTNNADVVVDRVRYDSVAPWPTNAAGGGQSLQLTDSAQDNARVSNWSDGSGWQYFTFTANINSSRLSISFNSVGGDVYLDDLVLVRGALPGAGANILANHDFELPLQPAWTATTLSTNSHRTNGIAHSGDYSLHLIQRPGSAGTTLFYQDITPPVVSNTTYSLSGWLLAGTNANTNLTLRAGTSFQARPHIRPVAPTPGGANLAVGTTPPYPTLWLNEIQPANPHGPTDAAGDRDPWLELHNPGPLAVSLDGLFLSDTYTNLARWAFPANRSIPPGGFLVVWCDGESGEATDDEFHTSFRVTPGSGSVALSRTVAGAPQLLDYFNYQALPAARSYGSVPDGQPFYRDDLYLPTPGATNDPSSAPIVVFINEWMAANTRVSGIADPADGDFDDWFELYNPGPTAVDLGGYFLTDNLANPLQFMIPGPGRYTIPPGGHLLVWADNETGQNATNRADLHVSFNLRAAGEAIGLFAADGTRIDAVTFTNQTENVSQGRSPDGGATVIILPTPTPRTRNPVVPPPAAPHLSDVAFTGVDEVSFTVSTIIGRRYQVEYTADPAAGQWTALGAPRTATESSLLVVDAPVTGPQRFYRVILLP